MDPTDDLEMTPPPPPPPPPPGAGSRPGGNSGQFPFAPKSGARPTPAPGPPPQPVPSPPEPGRYDDFAGDQIPAEGLSPAKRTAFIALAIGIGLLVIFAVVRTAWHIARPTPWKKSPAAEALAPNPPTPFFLALYTYDLMRMTEFACQEAVVLGPKATVGLPPSFDAMINLGMIESRAAWDGWGNPMTFDPATLTISSAGADGTWGTPDDLVHKMYESAQVPDSYWAPAGSFENTAQRHAVDSMQAKEAALDFRGTSLRMEP